MIPFIEHCKVSVVNSWYYVSVAVKLMRDNPGQEMRVPLRYL